MPMSPKLRPGAPCHGRKAYVRLGQARARQQEMHARHALGRLSSRRGNGGATA